jgi:hypothetical protein
MPINGHDDPDFAERLKPSRFDAPVARGGGLAGQPPAGGKGGGIVFLIVLVVVLAGLAVAAVKLGWL